MGTSMVVEEIRELDFTVADMPPCGVTYVTLSASTEGDPIRYEPCPALAEARVTVRCVQCRGTMTMDLCMPHIKENAIHCQGCLYD